MEQESSKRDSDFGKIYKWIRYIVTTCELMLVTTLIVLLLIFTVVNVKLSHELWEKPCQKLLCYRENKRLQMEMRSFNRRINNVNMNLKTEMHSFHHKINQMETKVQILTTYCTSIDRKVGNYQDIALQKLQTGIKTFHQKLQNAENKIQKLQSNSTLSRKGTETKIIEVKEQHNSFVKLFFVFSLYMTFALLIWMDNKNVICKMNTEKTETLSNEPGVVYFNIHQSSHLTRLTDSVMVNQKFFSIKEEKELFEINSKLVFISINFNDSLEAENDISQLKKCAVEVVENAGGKAVVIYQFHPDSRELEDGCLYPKNFDTIHRHPILQRLSQDHCVLTIYKNFSEYQKTHVEMLCQKYTAT